jgi:hypothetical protein
MPLASINNHDAPSCSGWFATMPYGVVHAPARTVAAHGLRAPLGAVVLLLLLIF